MSAICFQVLPSHTQPLGLRVAIRVSRVEGIRAASDITSLAVLHGGCPVRDRPRPKPLLLASFPVAALPFGLLSFWATGARQAVLPTRCSPVILPFPYPSCFLLFPPVSSCFSSPCFLLFFPSFSLFPFTSRPVGTSPGFTFFIFSFFLFSSFVDLAVMCSISSLLPQGMSVERRTLTTTALSVAFHPTVPTSAGATTVAAAAAAARPARPARATIVGRPLPGLLLPGVAPLRLVLPATATRSQRQRPQVVAAAVGGSSSAAAAAAVADSVRRLVAARQGAAAAAAAAPAEGTHRREGVVFPPVMVGIAGVPGSGKSRWC